MGNRIYLFLVILTICVTSHIRGAFAGMVHETVPITLSSGKVLPAKLVRPSENIGRRLPTLLVFGGFQEAGRVLELLQPEIPVVLASFDYPFQSPRRFAFPESLRVAPEAKQMIFDTLEGIKVLRASLAARDDVDPRRMIVVGASLGAPFAMVAAGADPGFQGIVLVHGFGDIPGTLKHQFLRSWKPKYGWLAHPAAWLLSHISWFYASVPEPEESAGHLAAGQSVLMVSAEADTFIPAASSDVLWQALRRSNARVERIVMPGDHLQPGSTDLIGEIMRRVTSWLVRVGLA